MRIDGASVIVTGGGSGLGEATARLLASCGAKLAVLDLDAGKAGAVAEAVGGVAAVGDVADEAAMSAALDVAQEHHGVPRVVVSCAGIAPAKRMLGKDGPMPLAEFRRAIDVNLVGTFNLLRLATARMAELEPLAENERGVVVMTASVAAFEGQIGQTAYAASKAGVAGLTLPAARELARTGIRVVTIAPGLFMTPMLAGLPEHVRTELGATVPFPNRLGRPAEYAALVRHCIENPMLNGEVIRLDGALRMPPR